MAYGAHFLVVGTLTRATEQSGKQSFCVSYLHQQLTIVRQITNVRVRDGKMTHHMPLVIRVLHSKTCEQRKVKRRALGCRPLAHV